MSALRTKLIGTADASGTCVVRFVPKGGRAVEVEGLSASTSGTAVPLLAVSVNGAFYIGSSNGNADSADGVPGIVLRGSDELDMTWTLASPGCTCTMLIFYSYNVIEE